MKVSEKLNQLIQEYNKVTQKDQLKSIIANKNNNPNGCEHKIIKLIS